MADQIMFSEHLNILYVSLRFHLKAAEDSLWPKHKASALRGGMGEMLLRMNCIQDRKCDLCGFEPECLVRRTLYSKMDIQPEFMSSGDSIGYVLECEDRREEFYRGDELSFSLILFGKTIVYFSQFLQAFYMLGREGIGRQHARFFITEVTNAFGEKVVSDLDVNLPNLGISSLEDYVRKKLSGASSTARLTLRSPLTIKMQGKDQMNIDIRLLLSACERRLYMMNCFIGNDLPRIDVEGHIPQMTVDKEYTAGVPRYSSTHDSKIVLRGVCGTVSLSELDDTAKILLSACELLHAGKNTSFGFGGYNLIWLGGADKYET